jgi:hypothetical protein
MGTKIKYYMVRGKDRYIPKNYYTKASSVAHAKQHFYIDEGDKIEYVIQITKKSYVKNKLI